MSNLENYYNILELKTGASPEEVKQAYRRLVKIYHPDVYPHNSPQQKTATKKFKKILEAYEVLKDHQPEQLTVTPSKSEKITSKPTSADICYQRGVDYAAQEQYEEAIQEFTLAIRLNSNYLEAYQYRAFILSKLGYEYRAAKDFEKIANLQGKSLKIPNYKQSYPFFFRQRKTKSQLIPYLFLGAFIFMILLIIFT